MPQPFRTAALLAGAIMALFSASPAGGITILPGAVPKPYLGPPGATSLDDFYRESAANEFTGNDASAAQVLLSVFDDSTFAGPDPLVLPSSASFVRGALQAWAEHLHLVLRPDEVWFTVLAQMSFYMNAHAADVRGIYAAPPFKPGGQGQDQGQGQGQDPMTLTDFEWFRVIQDFENEFERRARADWLTWWALPNFTTTTRVDEMTSAVLMLGMTERYASRSVSHENMRMACGLPSVTLLGELDDWQQLAQKLDRLAAFGPEPAAYGARLAPIFARFVASFEEPESAATRLFWNEMVSSTTCGSSGSGSSSSPNGPSPASLVSGWITGFFYWDDQGAPYARDSENASPRLTALDNTTYPALDVRSLPVGYTRAPFLIRDFNGTARFEAYVLGGNLGKQVSAGAPDGYADALLRANVSAANATAQSTLQPLSAWMLYGPVDFAAAPQRWVAEPELAGLAEGFNRTGC